MTADINSHKDVTREPVFSEKGYGKYSRDVGNTYIDVDISDQIVKLYKDGELEFSANCVTGCKAQEPPPIQVPITSSIKYGT